MKLFVDTFETPAGLFSVGVTADGALAATAFGDARTLRTRVRDCEFLPQKATATGTIRQQVLAYFAGERQDFDLPLAPAGTAFQQQVWAALRRISFGRTCTYAELAAAIGRPRAARAVGRANATNPICLVVPCHRVIGADGSLTGFAFGERIKRQLLALEGVTAFRAEFSAPAPASPQPRGPARRDATPRRTLSTSLRS
jgi:methylated-DNA-[protein]-cysteine S-methyltransferase